MVAEPSAEQREDVAELDSVHRGEDATVSRSHQSERVALDGVDARGHDVGPCSIVVEMPEPKNLKDIVV